MQTNLKAGPKQGPANDIANAQEFAFRPLFRPLDPAEEASHDAAAQQRQDVPALQKLLVENFAQPEPAQDETAQDRESAAKPARGMQPLSTMQSRILKSVAGLAILVSVGWMPVNRLLQVSSVEAVVNAQVVTLRAPIGGTVSEGVAAMRVGAPVTPGSMLLTVSDQRADRAAIDRATEELHAAQEDLAAATSRVERLTELRAALTARIADYRADRVRRVDAGLAAADARIASAQAVMDRAEEELARQAALSASGAGARTTRQTAERDLAVARASVEEAKAQKAVLAVEASALAAGRFFGDSYDDVPQSAQRLDAIDESLASLQAETTRLEARAKRLASHLEAEKGRFDLASRAPIAAPAGGRVWEILTAPGEQVVAGQPLVSVLDCSKLLATAAVSESVYNTLSIGMPASFAFRDGGRTFTGQVVQLSGVASAASNFAILPSALTKESYRATVSVDNLASDGACPVGQTGRVVFGAAS